MLQQACVTKGKEKKNTSVPSDDFVEPGSDHPRPKDRFQAHAAFFRLHVGKARFPE